MPPPAHPTLRIYLDACCLSRLTDNQSQPRVRREAEAVELILALARLGSLIWVSSAVLNIEVSRNPNPDHRRDAEALLAFAGEVVIPSEPEAVRPANHPAWIRPFRRASPSNCRAREGQRLPDDRRRPPSSRPAVSWANRRSSRKPCILVFGSAEMTSLDRMTDEDFERHALEILQRELGLDGLARFLRLNRTGTGDYTRDRLRWLAGTTIEDI